MNADLLNRFPQVRSFAEAIGPVLPAYRHILFSYVGVVHGGDTAILRARARLSAERSLSLRPTVSARTLLAGQISLDGPPKDVESLLGAALSGAWLPFSQNPLLKLLPESSGRYGDYYENSPPSRTRPLQEPERLVINGVGRFELLSPRQVEINRELNTIGYDTVDELMRAYGLEGSDQTTFEVAAAPVASIDPSSRLQGTHAQVAIRLASGLRMDEFRLIVRDVTSLGTANPMWISGAKIEWLDRGSYLEGSCEFELPVNSIIDCRAVYAGRIQQEIRLLDSRALPNCRRMIVDVIDTGLVRVKRLLTDPKEKERDDFEAAVALLLQMLGFAPAHIGSISGMQKEPDIFATGPGNAVLIVECTTGVPDDEKLMKLVSRAGRVRDAMEGSPGTSSPPLIITMLITPRPSEELLPIREKAEAHEVLVLCRPDVERMIDRTQFEPNAADMLRSWQGRVLQKMMTGGFSS